ncbi:superoxide dismutase, Fe-Mn family [Geoalkalibacter ferrihydriticus]|uniref:Superoxide dismutase n=2 Tax=Geoalkalibacter ferrihydriticus TaxID=392333 RepID=A0A0C2HX16_9BACT|nr:superoxide dismutase [Geoalkalibacter ferrihydriticus]KIH77327.1 superoxide dismutase [Geoalkalibacter ferrihydriticus DSM 17813]SDM19740.1 superoxide dismutase, Fe-Mn family [Geoalkalibacter ferrihydriticus]
MFGRKFVLSVVFLCVVPLVAATAFAKPFSLEPLPYASDALEPYIDKMTMEIHHGLHHQAYINNLNAQVKNFPQLEGMSLEEMMGKISTFSAAVRNNGGGHYNHDLFWKVMAPPGQGGEPSSELVKAIDKAFGTMDEMKKQFNQAGATRFGSGWAWLIVTADKELAVTSTANQDNPLMDIAEVKGTPILALDVWEHAYYLSYQNRRGAYLDFWWNLVNWNEVNRRYAEALR